MPIPRSDQSTPLIVPVVLCGGSGTRLWPLSRLGFPKQFLVLSDDGTQQSLFQQAVTRVNNLGTDGKIGSLPLRVGPTLIVTNEEHRFLVLDQLRELPSISAGLLLEPTGRNTAPALTLAALQSQDMQTDQSGEDCDPILIITPADHIVRHQ